MSINEFYWLAYATAVKSLLPQDEFDSTTSTLHIAPVTQRGILAGKWCPERVINYQLSAFADTLLPPDRPRYLSGGESYFQHLKT